MVLRSPPWRGKGWVKRRLKAAAYSPQEEDIMVSIFPHRSGPSVKKDNADSCR
jgi:hypothetical protein